MEQLIGIVGASGSIGKIISDILSKKYRVRGGQRHKDANVMNDNFTYHYLDIYDDISLDDFCNGCTVIVNCAGPSFKIKDRVARVSAKYHAKYIDLTGDMLFDDNIKSKLNLTDNCFVVGTGFVSGLSAIIPVYYSKKYFDIVYNLKCYQGSREFCSKNSLIDIMMSSISNSGYPDCYYNNGIIQQEIIDINTKISLSGFPENVFLKPYLSGEMIKMAELNNINQLHWYNAIPDAEIFDIAKNMYSGDITSVFDIESNTIEQYLKIFNAVANSKPLWNSLVYELSGIKNGKNINKRIICQIRNGYEICGVIASLAVDSLIKNSSLKGLYWGFEVVDSEEAILELINYGAIKDIICNDFLLDDNGQELEDEFVL